MAASRDRARLVMTIDELLLEMSSVVSRRHARALVSRATRLVGVHHSDALHSLDLLMVLESLAAEGGALQERAESLARRALYESGRGRVHHVHGEPPRRS